MTVLVSLRSFVSVVTVAATLAAMVVSSSHEARAADDAMSSEAKRHYEEGTKAFNLGEFARAIAEFKAAYNAKSDPVLLYNIAQSYRLAGDASQALFFYKSFLRNTPAAASNRKEAEAHIRKLEKQLEEQKREPTAAAPVPVVVPAASPPAPAVSSTPAASAAPSPSPSPSAASPPVSPAAGAAVGSASVAATGDMLRAPPPAVPPSTATEGSALSLTAPSTPPAEAESRPIYTRWWFWAGAAAAVAVIAGGIVAANARRPPSTALGTYGPRFR